MRFGLNYLFIGMIFALCGVCNGLAFQSKEIEIDADFPGGNIIVESVEGDTVTLRQDRRDTKSWWFYWCFRVRGAAGRTLTFKFTDGVPIGVRGPAISTDEGKSWEWMGPQPYVQYFKYSFPSDAGPVRFSFGMPYTEENFRDFVEEVGPNRALRVDTLCKSRKGRSVELLHVGKLHGEPKYRVFVTCRAHSCEMMTSYVAEGLVEAALGKDKFGKWFRNHVELVLIPFVDKDGVEDGDQGKNRHPRDHNRDYDEHSLYPETRAIQEFVPKWSDGKLRLTLDLHCPAIRGDYNEVIYIVESQNAETSQEQVRFSQILERVRKGKLIYRASDNLPFGHKWNTEDNSKEGPTGARWASRLPGVKLATTIEFPYANASGVEVNAKTARAFGRDLSHAIRAYLEAEETH